MADSSIQKKAIEAIIVLNAAFTNIRLYPPTSAMIGKSIDSAIAILQGIFEQQDSLIIAESERNLIISGHGLDEKEGKKPQVTAFIQLMLRLGIKSIAFEKGLEKSEILSFLEVVTRKPEDLRREGGIQKVMSGKNIKNILLDQKLYVAMDKGQREADAKTVSPPASSGDKVQLLQIKAGIESIIKGEDMAFKDRQVMHVLPRTVVDLVYNGKEKVADAIINKLAAGMLNEKEDVRNEASLAMARIGVKLISDKRMEDMIRLSRGLAAWIKFETMMPAAYKPICDQLLVLARHLILNHRLAEGMEVLKPFYLITSGKIKKDQPIAAMSANVLKSVAKDNLLDSLLKEFQTDENRLGEQALEILVMLGSNSLGPLLALSGQLTVSGAAGDLNAGVRLQEKICAALGRIGSQDAAPALKAISESNQSDAKVKAAADKALEMILKSHAEKAELPGKKDAASPMETGKPGAGGQAPVEDDVSRLMRLADQHVKNKDAGKAVRLLFDMIVKYAGEKEFDKAETLRDKLMEADPMALSDIIKSGDIIEEEKSKSIDQDHLNLWSELYKTMTKDETTILFFAMKPVRYDAGQTIFRKGDQDSRLYFINKGQVKVVVTQDDKEVVLNELKAGDMLGEVAFFSLSVRTASAITLSPVEMYYLEKDILAKWELKSYGIEAKLHDYFLKSERLAAPLEGKGLQLRTDERVVLSGKVTVQFMNASGAPVGDPVVGSLSDLSQGGLSFVLNIKKEKITKMFAEPRINLKFNLNTGGSQHRIDQDATMIAAVPHFYDYYIQAKFDKKLDKQIIDGAKAFSDLRNSTLEILMDS